LSAFLSTCLPACLAFDMRKATYDHCLQVNEADIKKWDVGLMVVNPDSVFSGAYLKVIDSILSSLPRYWQVLYANRWP